MSRRFAELLGAPEIGSIGAHPVKGLTERVDVFAPVSLPQPAAAE